MTVEAVLLTGGASRRMGRDKASLPVDGEPLAERLVGLLRTADLPVTVLGRESVGGADFLQDGEEFAGPLAALARFKPEAEAVFVLSCDMPLFDARVIDTLRQRIGGADAAVPVVGGWRQPLCALYLACSFAKIPGSIGFQTPSSALPLLQGEGAGRRSDKGSSTPGRKGGSMMAWLDQLDVVEVLEEQLGVDPTAVRNANTPEELEALLFPRGHP